MCLILENMMFFPLPTGFLSKILFSGTTLENKILLRNPVGSGKNIIFSSIKHMLDLNTSIASVHDLFVGVFRNPTVTANGGVLPTRNKKSGGSDTSTLLVNQNPTTSTIGILVTGDVVANQRHSDIKNLLLEPGDSYLIQLAVSDTGDGAFTILEWHEEDV
jgi:hypothetical protein